MGRDQTDGPLIWSASILGRPATTGIYYDLFIVYFHSIWKPQESWPRIEVEQMNHVFSFCAGLASPVVSHIWLSVADSDGAQAPKPPRIGVSEALDGGRCDCVYQPYHRPARIHFRRLATKHGVGRARNRWVCYGLLWLEPCWHLFSWMTVKSRTWQSDLFCPAKTEIIRDHCQGFPKFNKDLISLDPQPPRPFMMKHGVIYR